MAPTLEGREADALALLVAQCREGAREEDRGAIHHDLVGQALQQDLQDPGGAQQCSLRQADTRSETNYPSMGCGLRQTDLFIGAHVLNSLQGLPGHEACRGADRESGDRERI